MSWLSTKIANKIFLLVPFQNSQFPAKEASQPSPTIRLYSSKSNLKSDKPEYVAEITRESLDWRHFHVQAPSFTFIVNTGAIQDVIMEYKLVSQPPLHVSLLNKDTRLKALEDALNLLKSEPNRSTPKLPVVTKPVEPLQRLNSLQSQSSSSATPSTPSITTAVAADPILAHISSDFVSAIVKLMKRYVSGGIASDDISERILQLWSALSSKMKAFSKVLELEPKLGESIWTLIAKDRCKNEQRYHLPFSVLKALVTLRGGSDGLEQILDEFQRHCEALSSQDDASKSESMRFLPHICSLLVYYDPKYVRYIVKQTNLIDQLKRALDNITESLSPSNTSSSASSSSKSPQNSSSSMSSVLLESFFSVITYLGVSNRDLLIEKGIFEPVKAVAGSSDGSKSQLEALKILERFEIQVSSEESSLISILAESAARELNMLQKHKKCETMLAVLTPPGKKGPEMDEATTHKVLVVALRSLSDAFQPLQTVSYAILAAIAAPFKQLLEAGLVEAYIAALEAFYARIMMASRVSGTSAPILTLGNAAPSAAVQDYSHASFSLSDYSAIDLEFCLSELVGFFHKACVVPLTPHTPTDAENEKTKSKKTSRPPAPTFSFNLVPLSSSPVEEARVIAKKLVEAGLFTQLEKMADILYDRYELRKHLVMWLSLARIDPEIHQAATKLHALSWARMKLLLSGDLMAEGFVIDYIELTTLVVVLRLDSVLSDLREFKKQNAITDCNWMDDLEDKTKRIEYTTKWSELDDALCSMRLWRLLHADFHKIFPPSMWEKKQSSFVAPLQPRADIFVLEDAYKLLMIRPYDLCGYLSDAIVELLEFPDTRAVSTANNVLNSLLRASAHKYVILQLVLKCAQNEVIRKRIWLKVEGKDRTDQTAVAPRSTVLNTVPFPTHNGVDQITLRDSSVVTPVLPNDPTRHFFHLPLLDSMIFLLECGRSWLDKPVFNATPLPQLVVIGDLLIRDLALPSLQQTPIATSSSSTTSTEAERDPETPSTTTGAGPAETSKQNSRMEVTIDSTAVSPSQFNLICDWIEVISSIRDEIVTKDQRKGGKIEFECPWYDQPLFVAYLFSLGANISSSSGKLLSFLTKYSLDKFCEIVSSEKENKSTDPTKEDSNASSAPSSSTSTTSTASEGQKSDPGTLLRALESVVETMMTRPVDSGPIPVADVERFCYHLKVLWPIVRNEYIDNRALNGRLSWIWKLTQLINFVYVYDSCNYTRQERDYGRRNDSASSTRLHYGQYYLHQFSNTVSLNYQHTLTAAAEHYRLHCVHMPHVFQWVYSSPSMITFDNPFTSGQLANIPPWNWNDRMASLKQLVEVLLDCIMQIPLEESLVPMFAEGTKPKNEEEELLWAGAGYNPTPKKYQGAGAGAGTPSEEDLKNSDDDLQEESTLKFLASELIAVYLVEIFPTINNLAIYPCPSVSKLCANWLVDYLWPKLLTRTQRMTPCMMGQFYASMVFGSPDQSDKAPSDDPKITIQPHSKRHADKIRTDFMMMRLLTPANFSEALPTPLQALHNATSHFPSRISGFFVSHYNDPTLMKRFWKVMTEKWDSPLALAKKSRVKQLDSKLTKQSQNLRVQENLLPVTENGDSNNSLDYAITSYSLQESELFEVANATLSQYFNHIMMLLEDPFEWETRYIVGVTPYDIDDYGQKPTGECNGVFRSYVLPKVDDLEFGQISLETRDTLDELLDELNSDTESDTGSSISPDMSETEVSSSASSEEDDYYSSSGSSSSSGSYSRAEIRRVERATLREARMGEAIARKAEKRALADISRLKKATAESKETKDGEKKDKILTPFEKDGVWSDYDELAWFTKDVDKAGKRRSPIDVDRLRQREHKLFEGSAAAVPSFSDPGFTSAVKFTSPSAAPPSQKPTDISSFAVRRPFVGMLHRAGKDADVSIPKDEAERRRTIGERAQGYISIFSDAISEVLKFQTTHSQLYDGDLGGIVPSFLTARSYMPPPTAWALADSALYSSYHITRSYRSPEKPAITFALSLILNILSYWYAPEDVKNLKRRYDALSEENPEEIRPACSFGIIPFSGGGGDGVAKQPEPAFKLKEKEKRTFRTSFFDPHDRFPSEESISESSSESSESSEESLLLSSSSDKYYAPPKRRVSRKVPVPQERKRNSNLKAAPAPSEPIKVEEKATTEEKTPHPALCNDLYDEMGFMKMAFTREKLISEEMLDFAWNILASTSKFTQSCASIDAHCAILLGALIKIEAENGEKRFNPSHPQWRSAVAPAFCKYASQLPPEMKSSPKMSKKASKKALKKESVKNSSSAPDSSSATTENASVSFENRVSSMVDHLMELLEVSSDRLQENRSKDKEAAEKKHHPLDLYKFQYAMDLFSDFANRRFERDQLLGETTEILLNLSNLFLASPKSFKSPMLLFGCEDLSSVNEKDLSPKEFAAACESFRDGTFGFYFSLPILQRLALYDFDPKLGPIGANLVLETSTSPPKRSNPSELKFLNAFHMFLTRLVSTPELACHFFLTPIWNAQCTLFSRVLPNVRSVLPFKIASLLAKAGFFESNQDETAPIEKISAATASSSPNVSNSSSEKTLADEIAPNRAEKMGEKYPLDLVSRLLTFDTQINEEYGPQRLLAQLALVSILSKDTANILKKAHCESSRPSALLVSGAFYGFYLDQANASYQLYLLLQHRSCVLQQGLLSHLIWSDLNNARASPVEQKPRNNKPDTNTGAKNQKAQVQLLRTLPRASIDRFVNIGSASSSTATKICSSPALYTGVPEIMRNGPIKESLEELWRRTRPAGVHGVWEAETAIAGLVARVLLGVLEPKDLDDLLASRKVTDWKMVEKHEEQVLKTRTQLAFSPFRTSPITCTELPEHIEQDGRITSQLGYDLLKNLTMKYLGEYAIAIPGKINFYKIPFQQVLVPEDWPFESNGLAFAMQDQWNHGMLDMTNEWSSKRGMFTQKYAIDTTLPHCVAIPYNRVVNVWHESLQANLGKPPKKKSEKAETLEKAEKASSSSAPGAAQASSSTSKSPENASKDHNSIVRLHLRVRAGFSTTNKIGHNFIPAFRVGWATRTAIELINAHPFYSVGDVPGSFALACEEGGLYSEGTFIPLAPLSPLGTASTTMTWSFNDLHMVCDPVLRQIGFFGPFTRYVEYSQKKDSSDTSLLLPEAAFHLPIPQDISEPLIPVISAHSLLFYRITKCSEPLLNTSLIPVPTATRPTVVDCTAGVGVRLSDRTEDFVNIPTIGRTSARIGRLD